MHLGFGLALLIATMLMILLTWDSNNIAGFTHGQFATAVSAMCALVLVGGWGFRMFRGQMSQGLLMLAAWAGIFFVFAIGYGFRDEFRDIRARVAGTFVPGSPVSTRDGEVMVVRDADGSFDLDGEVNDTKLSFIFDTGASRVVLRYEDARRIGLDPEKLEFTQEVFTANGRTQVAPVTLDSVKVGTIRVSNVQASVSKQGALAENLLGMTFLSRLASYEVRGDRLILRGR